MRKSLIIFLLAVLLPSGVLGWLALRSAEEQKIILERRTAELYQKEVDSLAVAARAVVDDQRRAFAETVRKLLAGEDPEQVANDFPATLAKAWSRKSVGFAIGKDGRLLAPSPRAAANQTEWQKFLYEQGPFLGGRVSAQVYTVPVDELQQPELVRKLKTANRDNESAYAGSLSSQSQQIQKNAPAPVQAPAASAPLPVPGLAKRDAAKADELRMRMDFPPPTPAAAEAKQVPDMEERAPQRAMAKDAKKEASPAPSAAKEAINGSRAAKPSATSALGTVAPEKDTRAPNRPTLLPAELQDRAVTTKPAAASEPAPRPATAAKSQDAPRPDRGAESQSRVQGADKAKSIEDAPVDDRVRVEAEQLAENEIKKRLAQLRNVAPQQQAIVQDRAAWSALAPETAEFRVLTAGIEEGLITRFVQDRLSIIFWLRPAQAPELIFGCLIDAADLADLWPAAMPALPSVGRGGAEFVLALLDDKARPAAISPASEGGREWKRPFVASEIGEVLPHWEAALYLMRPEQLQESVRGVRRTLTFLVVAMVGAIALGGWLVVADARRQLALAQQKTDFVSNVSHELKTPLTSIRMFAELMLGGRGETNAKAPQYLRIIMVEAERLTRLINNVLDFATLERRQKRFEKKPLDLHAVIARTWENHELHLSESGFATRWEAAPGPYPVVGDEDALAQILVNLLSNAEKYCAEHKEVELHSYIDDGHVCVSVLDRGLGVPDGEERKIFEAFYRAHDSLSSGIQGSGLGLTLACRLAREHGGEIVYAPRKDGGSSFTLRIPCAERG
jgi:signal transduction histidine kinase